MYEEFYGLTGSPFRLTPDHRYYYGSEGHRKAMSYLKYGLYQGEGFIVVTGDVGLGKSTLVGQLFEELDRNEIVAAQIGSTQVDPDEAIRMICLAFDLEAELEDKPSLLRMFERFLREHHAAGRRVLLVVDEAQNLPMRTLEELRMLSNFSLSGQPLFQAFLVGQPQFLRALSHPDLAQLQQRVIASYRLEALNPEETRDYVLHRLEMAGWKGDPSFEDDVFEAIHADTKGVPRRINTLCNRLLLYGALEELRAIDRGAAETVIKDLEDESVAAGVAPRRPARTDLSADAPAALAVGAEDGAGVLAEAYPPYMTAPDVEKALTALRERLTRMEETLSDHEAALRELIDVTVGPLAEAEGDAAASASRRPPR